MRHYLLVCSIAALAGCGLLEDSPIGMVPDSASGGDADEGDRSPAAAAQTAEETDERVVTIDIDSDEVELPAPLILTEQDAVDIVFEAANDADSQQTMSGTFAQSNLWDTTAEGGFLDLINQERRQRGLEELLVYWDLQDDARSHTRVMETTNDLHHNPNLGRGGRRGGLVASRIHELTGASRQHTGGLEPRRHRRSQR